MSCQKEGGRIEIEETGHWPRNKDRDSLAEKKNDETHSFIAS